MQLMATGRKRSFDAAFKLQVVAFAEKSSNRGAVRQYKVDKKCVREWKLQKRKLKELCALKKKPKKRLPGGRGNSRLGDLEEHLVPSIDEMHSRNLRETCRIVQRKAVELYASHSDTVSGQGSLLVASRGWFQRFLKRWGLSIRRCTTVGQRLPSDLVDKVVQFIMSTRKLRMQNNYI